MSGFSKFFQEWIRYGCFFLRMWQWSFNEVISLIDQAMSMEPPTAGMIGVALQEKFVQLDRLLLWQRG